MTPAFADSSRPPADLPLAAAPKTNDPGHIPPAPAAGGVWRNPPYAIRVGLVAAVWAVPGVLFGLLASLFTTGVCDPATAAVVGGGAFGAAGAWQEALW